MEGGFKSSIGYPQIGKIVSLKKIHNSAKKFPKGGPKNGIHTGDPRLTQQILCLQQFA